MISDQSEVAKMLQRAVTTDMIGPLMAISIRAAVQYAVENADDMRDEYGNSVVESLKDAVANIKECGKVTPKAPQYPGSDPLVYENLTR